MRNYIEKVAAGVRMMQHKPNAFLFCESDEYTWDEPTILGIPVFHSPYVFNSLTDENVPFIPLWGAAGEYSGSRRQFNDGFVG